MSLGTGLMQLEPFELAPGLSALKDPQRPLVTYSSECSWRWELCRRNGTALFLFQQTINQSINIPTNNYNYKEAFCILDLSIEASFLWILKNSQLIYKHIKNK